jgi:hypothetical protein
MMDRAASLNEGSNQMGLSGGLRQVRPCRSAQSVRFQLEAGWLFIDHHGLCVLKSPMIRVGVRSSRS